MCYFDEEVRTYRQDHDLSPMEARERAADSAIEKWLRQNPPPAGQHDICSHCGNTISDSTAKVIDVRTGADRPPEFHWQCHAKWLAARRQLARNELHRLFRDHANTDKSS